MGGREGARVTYLKISNIRGTLLGVPVIRNRLFWDRYRGPPILGIYHLDPRPEVRVS